MLNLRYFPERVVCVHSVYCKYPDWEELVLLTQLSWCTFCFVLVGFCLFALLNVHDCFDSFVSFWLKAQSILPSDPLCKHRNQESPPGASWELIIPFKNIKGITAVTWVKFQWQFSKKDHWEVTFRVSNFIVDQHGEFAWTWILIVKTNHAKLSIKLNPIGMTLQILQNCTEQQKSGHLLRTSCMHW